MLYQIRKLNKSAASDDHTKLGRSGRAVTEKNSFSSKFGKTRDDNSLQQIEEILDSLNQNTSEITSIKCGHGMNFKENVSALQLYPRPNETIKGLIRMIDDVVDDD